MISGVSEMFDPYFDIHHPHFRPTIQQQPCSNFFAILHARNGERVEVPSNENKKLLYFQSFHVSNCQIFKVSEIETNPAHVCWKILIPYYQIFISCFLEDIDPLFQNFQTY